MSSEKEKNNVLFPKYWANRTLIFVIIGFVPLLSGIMFLVTGLETSKSVHKSNDYEINAVEVFGNQPQNEFELILKIENRTIRDTLEYHDDWYNLLGKYGKPGIRQRVLSKQNLEYALQKIEKEKPQIKVYMNERTKAITGLKIDGNTIIPHYNFLLMGMLFTALGIFMIGGSTYIILKDPYHWYQNKKSGNTTKSRTSKP